MPKVVGRGVWLDALCAYASETFRPRPCLFFSRRGSWLTCGGTGSLEGRPYMLWALCGTLYRPTGASCILGIPLYDIFRKEAASFCLLMDV